MIAPLVNASIGVGQADDFMRELCHGIREHGAPFTIDDIAEIMSCEYDEGDYAECNIRGRVRLADGRVFDVEGGCDTTGWDCRSSLDVTEVKS